MGRPKKENPMSAKERIKKFRSDPEKRLRENEKKKAARKSLPPMTEDQLKEKREKDRIRKQNSRNQESRQKTVGTRIKDRNRKAKEKAAAEEPEEPDSTIRSRRHRERLKVALNFPARTKRRKIHEATSTITKSLVVLSPQSKVKTIAIACSKSLSPASTSVLSASVQQSNPLSNLYTSLKRKRDSGSNCARRLVLNQLSTQHGGSPNKVRRSARNMSWRSLQQAANMDVQKIVIHYKTVKSTAPKPPTETVKKVRDFYNLDTTSRQLPYKNMTRKIKDCYGVYHRVAVRVMEITLKKAYERFKLQHPDVKIGRRSFEKLRPKNVRLRQYAQRLQCCCTYHTNMDYIRKAVNKLFSTNGKACPFPNSDALISAALCQSNSLKCILRICPACKNFPKLDNLQIASLKCSKSCLQKNEDCKKHTTNVKLFDRVVYIHKEKEKKKLALVDKSLTAAELVELLKNKMKQFPLHRFNVQQTAKTYEKLVANLNESNILKIHDFSENYTCLLPEEIMTIHWTQDQATVYPIVVLRKVGEDVREDHLVFISDDRKHDVPFVELCNEMVHEYYEQEGLEITHDIEYNDGCASQFKCIRAFSSLARRPIKTTRVFCETSHGKSKSDGLGGVVKSYATKAVCGEKKYIRNADELYNFLHESLTVEDNVDSSKPMLNRKFFLVTSEKVKDYRDSFPNITYHHIDGTLKIHEVRTAPGDTTAIYYRNSSCGCKHCLNGEYTECESLEEFSAYPQQLCMKEHKFRIKSKGKGKGKKSADDAEDDEANELDEEEAEEWEEDYIETEASKFIQEGDIAVIKTGDDFQYYLLKLTSSPFELQEQTTDDYNHKFPPFHRVVEGNYLEVHMERPAGVSYYVDYKKKALISAFCVVGNCPSLPTSTEKRKGKMVDMFLVDNEMHQSLMELVASE